MYPVVYISTTYKVAISPAFATWIHTLRDARAKARIGLRIDQISLGNFGDRKFVGDDVSELRIDVGPGYRVYYTVRGKLLVVLPCGGDKSSQSRDIRRAQQMAKDL